MVCKSCGQTFHLEGAAVFCPLCGAPLDGQGEGDVHRYLSEIHTLRGDINRALDEYRGSLGALYRELRTTRNPIKIITADDVVSRDGSHGLFLERAEQAIQRTEELLKSPPDDPRAIQAAKELAFDVTHLFLHGKTMFDDAGRWTFIACEHLTVRLFPYLELDSLCTLHKMFLAETPSRHRMPNETELLKQLNKRIKELKSS